MKKFMLMTAAALAFAVPATAQVPSIPSLGCTQPYYVKEGDNLWTLAAVRWQNPELWRWLVQQNPILQEPGRIVNRGGREIVLIRPDEALYCLEEAGINIGSTSAVTPTVPVVVQPVTSDWKFSNWLGENWGWLLLLLGIGAVVWFLRELSKDPVRSGAPQVTGGVNDQTVRDQLQRRGSQQDFTLIPGSIARGRGYGRMMVSYFGGREHLRTLRGETIYRARALFNDGREEDIYTLQGCGNDVTYGGALYRTFNNFRFEPEAEGVGEPVVAPTPEPVEALTASAPSADGDDEEVPVGTIIVKIDGPRAAGDKALLQVDGASLDGLRVEISGRRLKVRWDPDEDPVETK